MRLFVLLVSLLTFFFGLPMVAQAADTTCAAGMAYSIDISHALPADAPVIRPFASLLFNLPASTKAEWIVDGTTKATASPTFCTHFETNGTKHIEAHSENGGASYSLDLPVVSYPNIKIAKLLPNPVDSSGVTEEIVLTNGNPFAVTLTNWQLKNRASRTKATFTLTLPAMGQATTYTKGKLVNDGGTYDLANESDNVVDSLTYPVMPKGAYVTHDGVVPLAQTDASVPPPGSASTTPPASSQHATVTGQVIKPDGNTIDIQSASGQPVHIVIHSSFTGSKPKLHKGDTIMASGIWLTSKNGPYLSVRQGDTFELVKDSGSAAVMSNASSPDSTRALADTPAETASSPVIPTDSASSPLTDPVTATIDQPVAADVSLPTDGPLRWLFVAMITLGSGLTLPLSRGKSV